jgi:hypothetical protein
MNLAAPWRDHPHYPDNHTDDGRQLDDAVLDNRA